MSKYRIGNFLQKYLRVRVITIVSNDNDMLIENPQGVMEKIIQIIVQKVHTLNP
jgi:deoxyxylulose-5-phosphate synthase